MRQQNDNIIKSVSVVRKTTTEKLSVRVLRSVDVTELLRDAGYESIKILNETIVGSYKIVGVEVNNGII